MNTKFQILTILIIGVFINCSNGQIKKQELTGDLYFDYYRLGSTYHLPDSISKKILLYFDTFNTKNATEEEKKEYETFQILKKHNIIHEPYVDLLVNNDSIVKLYLDTIDYNKIRIYKLQDLQSKNKKIIIKALTLNYSKGIYYCSSLIDVKMVDGQTLRIQKKFRIEDYK